MTPEMLNLQWNTVALYPAGYFARRITVAPSVKLPDGWQFATALEAASTPRAAATTFKPVAFETLVDSPMYRRPLLPSGSTRSRRQGAGAPRHRRRPAELLEMQPEQIEAHRALVQQAYKLYGSHHYDHYDFLFALSDQMAASASSITGPARTAPIPDYFTDWDRSPDTRDLLPHEYTHSWNGKFRRPADLWTPNFNVPMRDSLLWVYEGQTQYWGFVLAARSGLTIEAAGARRAGFDGGDLRHARRPRSGARCRTRPTIRSSRTAARCRGAAGSGARTTTARAS